MTFTQFVAALAILLTIGAVGIRLHKDIKNLPSSSCTEYNYLYIDGATVTIDGKGVEGSSVTATSSVKCE